jgi:hypothetical protein
MRWLNDGFAQVTDLRMLGAGAIAGLLTQVPIAGVFAYFWVMAGMLIWIVDKRNGRDRGFGTAFSAPMEYNLAGPVLLLGVPALVVGLVIAVAVGTLLVVLVAAIFAAGTSNINGELFGIGLVGTFLVLFAVGLVIIIVIQAMYFFAVTRVVFNQVQPFAAILESLKTSWAHAVPVLLVVVITGLMSMVLALIGTLLIPGLGGVLGGAVSLPLMAGATLAAHEEIFGPVASKD